jgi:hypothetical protein
MKKSISIIAVLTLLALGGCAGTDGTAGVDAGTRKEPYEYIALNVSRVFHRRSGCLSESDSDIERVSVNGQDVEKDGSMLLGIVHEDNESISLWMRIPARGLQITESRRAKFYIDGKPFMLSTIAVRKDAPVHIKSKKVIRFKNREEAVESGRTPCRFCCESEK